MNSVSSSAAYLRHRFNLGSKKVGLIRNQMVLDVSVSAAFLEVVVGHTGQAQGFIQFPEGQETGVGGDGGTVKFQADLGVELEPEGSLFAITHRVPLSLEPAKKRSIVRPSV
jgi:hypothetical protein